MNEKKLEIFQKIIEGNNKTNQRYVESLYDIESMIKVAAASVESMEHGTGIVTIDLMDIQRVLNVAADTLRRGTTGELIDYLCEL